MASKITDHIKTLRAYAAGLGFTLDDKSHKHLCWRRPNTQPVFSSRVPGDRRALERTKCDLRRAVRQAEEEVA